MAIKLTVDTVERLLRGSLVARLKDEGIRAILDYEEKREDVEFSSELFDCWTRCDSAYAALAIFDHHAFCGLAREVQLADAQELQAEDIEHYADELNTRCIEWWEQHSRIIVLPNEHVLVDGWHLEY